MQIFNKRPSNGKNLNGKCPDDLFYEEYKEKIVTSKDAMYALAKRMIDDFLYETNNNLFVDPSRINIFINLTNEFIKKENKQSYTKEEFLKIVKQVINIDKEMDLDFQNMMLEDWDY